MAGGPGNSADRAIAARFVAPGYTLLMPSESATFTVLTRATFTTQFDGLAQSIYALQEGLQLGINILTKFGFDTTLSVPDALNVVMQETTCAASLRHPDGGKIIADCFSDPKTLFDAFGAKGLFLGAALSTGSVAAFFQSELDALGDQLNSRDHYRLSVYREGDTSGSKSSPTRSTTSRSSPASSHSSNSFTATKTWTWDTKNSDGYTAHYTFETGTAASLSAVPIMSGFTQQSEISSACSDFNPRTDALLPVRLTLRNTTSGFSRDVSTFVDLQESFVNNALADLEVVADYSAGVQCEDMRQQTASNDQSSWAVTCHLEPGASCANDGYLILRNYYSPDTPSGSPNALNPLNISVSDTTTTSEESFTDASGPGSRIVLGDALYIPLSGTEPSG